MLLAIDTSTQFAGVLLWKNGAPERSLCWRSGRNATASLIPAVQRLLQEAGGRASDLHGVAVALGPGGFSALRVGMSAAKGFALALNIPIVGVSTLEAEAYPYANLGTPICPLIGVGRREVAWAGYQGGVNGWRQTGPEEITTPASLPQLIPPGSLLCGEGLAANEPLLREALGTKAILMEYPGPSQRLWALARLASERMEGGLAGDPAALQPLYLRRPSITPPNPPRKIKP